VLHQGGVSFDLYYGARKHKIKIKKKQLSHIEVQILPNVWMVYVGECAVYMTGLAGLRRINTVSAIFRFECIRL
jgi:hypothetical protein